MGSGIPGTGSGTLGGGPLLGEGPQLGESPLGTGSGVMTTQERVAILDGELGSAYEDFDGFILSERSRAQRQSNEVGADPSGLYEGQGDGSAGGDVGGIPGITGLPGVSAGSGPQGDGADSGQGGTVAGTGGVSGQGPQAGGSGGSVGGVRGGPGADGAPQFPAPDDIPSGRDDDVVARQIREAAMREPDPELRERLWDEYRRYTGLSN